MVCLLFPGIAAFDGPPQKADFQWRLSTLSVVWPRSSMLSAQSRCGDLHRRIIEETRL
jgi:hypothetical protein